MAAPEAKTTVGMPAGHARDEQRRVNADAGAKAIDEMAATTGAIDPAALQPDREVLYDLLRDERSQIDVEGAQRGYVYCWVRAFNEAGRPWDDQLIEKKRHRIRDRETGEVSFVWQLVNDEKDPEAPSCIDKGTGYAGAIRKIGDCVLMRARADWYALLQSAQRAERDEREGRTLDELAAHARRETKGGLILHDMAGMTPAQFAEARRQGLRRDTFNGPVDRALRTGTVPGLPTPGR